MTIERFAALVDAYGADRRRWPTAEQGAALALLANDPRARALLVEARLLDETLDGEPSPAVSPALRAAVLAATPTPSQARRWAAAATARFWVRTWGPGAGLVAAGVAGVMFGAVLAGGSSLDAGAQSLLAEADSYDEFVLAEGETS
jgi:hypothetical protein